MPSDSSDSDSVDWDSLKTVNTFDGLDETDKKRHVNFGKTNIISSYRAVSSRLEN